MFLWILVFTLSLVSDVSPFSRKVLYVNFISARIRKFQVQSSFFWMLQSDFVLSSSTQSVSQILAYFTSRKSCSFEVLSLHVQKKTTLAIQLCALQTPGIACLNWSQVRRFADAAPSKATPVIDVPDVETTLVIIGDRGKELLNQRRPLVDEIRQ